MSEAAGSRNEKTQERATVWAMQFDRLPAWLPFAAAAAGLAVYLVLSWRYAHTQASVLDEGMYLYKGWLFATGRYTPFQDFGPWTNHMPLSYLLPGWFQLIFGPGLRTGRLLAMATGSLSAAGIWTLSRRFGGAWWGAAAVWAVALNPAVTKMFSVQASQGLAACLLIGSLVFTLGAGRRSWELAAGGLLAGALALTRINLVPVLPLLAVYTFAVHGRRAGAIFSAAALSVFGLGHAVFWPGIIRLWTPWLPDAVTPFLDSFRRPPTGGGLWAPEVDLRSRAASFMQGLRFHIIPVSAFAAALAFWPAHPSGWARDRRLTALLLLALFGLLFLMHAWAALAQDYCVFCFPVYLSFFSLSALALLPLTFPHWNPQRPRARWVVLAVLLASAALGASAADVVGPGLLEQPAVVRLLRVEVPRTSGPGTIPLWGFLENVTGRDYETLVRSGLLLGRITLAGLIGVAAGASGLVLARRFGPTGRPFAHRAAAWALALGLVLSPTPFLAGGYKPYDCSGDVIAAYEDAAAQIESIASPGALVFWWTEGSPAPLLHLPDIRIFPAQLNGAYSFKFGGDPEALARYGHWNRELAEAWLLDADLVLVDADVLDRSATAWLAGSIAGAGFEPAGETGPLHPCDPGSVILIYRR